MAAKLTPSSPNTLSNNQIGGRTHVECTSLPRSVFTFQGGYTLAMRAIGSRDLCVHLLQTALQDTFGLSPGANLYLTPQGAASLKLMVRICQRGCVL